MAYKVHIKTTDPHRHIAYLQINIGVFPPHEVCVELVHADVLRSEGALAYLTNHDVKTSRPSKVAISS